MNLAPFDVARDQRMDLAEAEKGADGTAQILRGPRLVLPTVL